MSATRHVAAVAAMLAGWIQPAGACPQALATYEQAGTGVLLTFDGATAETDAMLHRFRVVFGEPAVTLDGVVMMVDSPVRAWGVVMHQCPEGDVTGAEIAACTIWEGDMVSIDAAGTGTGLPVVSTGNATMDAATTLQLPEFGKALATSPAWTTAAGKEPADRFELKGCQE